MKITIKFTIIFVFINLSIIKVESQIGNPNWIWGVTLDDVDTNLIAKKEALSHFIKKPTTRVVFDEWRPANTYINAVQQLHQVSYIMGDILDSEPFYLYNHQQFTDRIIEYVTQTGLQENVDIWEIGNEVNGEWLGSIPEVIAKLETAYQQTKILRNKTISFTFYYNHECWENPNNEMFHWIDNYFLPSRIDEKNIDYIFVAYYEDDCNNYQPNWVNVFRELHSRFPNSVIGIGECGTNIQGNINPYISKYYQQPFILDNISANVQGGVFWWYFIRDCIPYQNNPRWNIINNLMKGISGIINDNPGSGHNFTLNVNNDITEKTFSLAQNYPNPFNPSTNIKFDIAKEGMVKLNVYDISGNLVSTVVNENYNAGSYSINFNASSLSSGVYFYKLETADFTAIKKMILVK
ncbi:MAG: T9SS C-terminal target domain-containing protein [Ignavibacteriae bacterium]|nr:MAG: T9SS C-terminal target domain-containing protein [Ignavibacteriota bacterium]